MGNVTNVKFPAFLLDGFVASSLRGMDSCGLAVIDSKHDIDFHKLPVNGSMFIQDRRTKELITSVNATKTIAMGHTRAATVGRVTMNNAHPFYLNDANNKGDVTREFIGCHNGTLTVPGTNPFDTDSEWALDVLMEQGKDAFKKFNGAYALTWWDSNHPEDLNIALNGGREVHIARLSNGGLLYASEAGMLHWLAERNQLAIDGALLQLQSFQHYKFNVKNPTKYTKESIPPYQHTSHTSHKSYTPYLTHVEHVENMLNKVSAAPEAQADSTTKVVKRVGAATAAQVQAARDFSLLGVKGQFHMFNYNRALNRAEGIFSVKMSGTNNEVDYSAVVNGYGGGVTLSKDIPWPTTIVGIEDDADSKELLLFLSKPIMSLVPTKEQPKQLTH